MRFGLILTGVTFLTIGIIFGVYRIFLYKPTPPPSPSIIPIQNQVATESLPVSSDPPATPAPTPEKGQKAIAVPLKSTIGTLSVLQDNTTGVSSLGGSAISGSINLAGSPPAGTSIVIVARPNNSSESFKTVVSGIGTSGTPSWNWTTANIGTTYDMVAVLKGSSNGVDTDYAQSQTYIVSAPSRNQIFSLNAATAPSAPTGNATITCGTKAPNNTWSANINFPAVGGAAFYKMQLGTTSGAFDVNNTAQPAQSGTNQIINVNINDSVTYYAQYSIANVLNPTAFQYSSFSAPTTVKCPN